MQSMIKAKDAKNINAAIKRLDAINILINTATVLPDFVKRDALLLCLLDIGNLINNGEFKSLSEQIFHQFGGQILWDRLRDIRNDIIHRYYNNVAINCFNAQFVTDCQNLGRLLKAIILTAPQTYQDANINYIDANRNALFNNLAVFGFFYTTQHGARAITEVSGIEKLLVLHRCFNNMKYCLSLGNILTLPDEQKMMISLCLELNKLLIEQILENLNKTDNAIYTGITEQAREVVFQVGMREILRAHDSRNQRAHRLDIKKPHLQDTITESTNVITLHPLIMTALYTEGFNIVALLEAKHASVLASHQSQNKVTQSLVLEINQLIHVCNAIPMRVVAPRAISIYPDLIALSARGRAVIDLHTLYSITFSTNYPAIKSQVTQNLNMPGTVDYNAIWARAQAFAMPFFQPSNNFLFQAILQICNERTHTTAVQAIINTINRWPQQVAEAATWLAFEWRLSQPLVRMAEYTAYKQAHGQAQLLAVQPNWNVVNQLAIRQLAQSTDQEYFQVYNELYREEVGTNPPPGWLASLLGTRSIQVFEADYHNRLRRLTATQLLLAPPPPPIEPTHTEKSEQQPTADSPASRGSADKLPAAVSSSLATKRKVGESIMSEDQQEATGSATQISAAFMTSGEAQQKVQKANEKEQSKESKVLGEEIKGEKNTSREQEKSVELDKSSPSAEQDDPSKKQ